MGGNIKIKLIISLLLTIFTFLILSCKLFSDEDETIKDPRTYDLTIDTIRYEGEWGYFYNLWGSSDNDVYLVGHFQKLLSDCVWTHFTLTPYLRSSKLKFYKPLKMVFMKRIHILEYLIEFE